MGELLFAILLLIAITLIPALELRFSIPVGILATTIHLPLFGDLRGLGLHWAAVFLICVLTNIVLGPVWYWLLDTIVRWSRHQWPWFGRFYQRKLEKAQRRIHERVERWGWLGLALFIGIPFPGSGVYTGGIVAYALGTGQKKFLYATIIGVLIAGVLVTLLTLGLVSAFGF